MIALASKDGRRWPAPAGDLPGRGYRLLLKNYGKRTCKPNSVVCGHSSRRRVAADAHQRPTRRFRRDPEPSERIGPMRSAAWLQAAAFLPIWSCSMWGLPCPRPHGRSGALLPHHFTLTSAGILGVGEPIRGRRMPYLRCKQRVVYDASHATEKGVAEAVSFLWHWPSTGLDARVPDVIRHTALRSSDFPPPGAPRFRVKCPAATARSSCQEQFYRSCGREFGGSDFSSNFGV